MAEKKKTKAAEKPAKLQVKNMTHDPDRIPAKLFAGLVCLCLFIVHLVVIFQPTGTLPMLYKSLMLGLFGKVGFWFWLFCLPYLFWVLVIMRNGKPLMRSSSAIAFVLICGMSLQMLVPETKYSGFFTGIVELFKGGINGTTAGFICGGLGLMFRRIFGNIISFMLLALLAAFFLLRTMEITLTGLYRAIQERPRDTAVGEKEIVPRDHAADLVNHIARRHIEHNRRMRQMADEDDFEYYDDEEDAEPVAIPGSRFVKGIVSNIREHRFFDVELDEDDDIPALPEHKAVSKRDSVMKAMEEEIDEPLAVPDQPEPMPELVMEQEPVKKETAPKPEKKMTKKQVETTAEAVAQELDKAAAAIKPPYCFPPINLLKMPPRTGVSGTDEMKENSRRLNDTLESFNISAHIVNVTRGPSVTRYEVELEKGVRLNKLTTCADDIALSLGTALFDCIRPPIC